MVVLIPLEFFRQVGIDRVPTKIHVVPSGGEVALLAGTDAITEQSNFIFSPLSLRAGLALLAAGTNGGTLRQLLAFLGSQELHLLNDTNANLLAEMGTWPQLSFAAGIFADRSVSLRPEFVSAAASAHGAFASTVDFKNQPEAAAAEVNALIAHATGGRLRSLVSPASFRGDTKMVLANAMHFKATWSRRFDPSDTVHRDFHRLDGTEVKVPFLSDPGKHMAAIFDDDLGFKVLQLFYETMESDDGGRFNPASPRFCMLIFLPDRRDALRDLLRLAATEPGFVTRCVPEDSQEVIPCMVPKFKFAFGFDATDPLRSLGLAAPFDPQAADLSGAVASCTPAMEGLYVSSVEQVCGVEVDEEGTTAVGVLYEPSSPTYSPGQPPPPPPMSFVADHPFMFAVVECNKAEVLFLGHVVDPSKEL